MNVSPDGMGIVRIDGSSPAEYPSISEFAAGTVVSLEAVPVPGCMFIGWGGGYSGTDNPTTVDMTCSRDITANFSPELKKLAWPVIGGVGGVVIAGGLTIGLFALVKRHRRS